MPHLSRHDRRVERARSGAARRRTTARPSTSCVRSRDATLLPVALIGQAGVLARRDPATALKVAAAASAIRARVGGEFAPFYRARLERVRAVARGGARRRRRARLGGGRAPRRRRRDRARVRHGDAASGFAGRAERPRAGGRRPGGRRASRTRRSPRACTSPCERSRATCVTCSPRSGSTTARSSRPGRASAFSSDSAVALMTARPARAYGATQPAAARAEAGNATKGATWRSA